MAKNGETLTFFFIELCYRRIGFVFFAQFTEIFTKFRGNG